MQSERVSADRDSLRFMQQFADMYRSGAQGAEMDADAAQALALSIDDILRASASGQAAQTGAVGVKGLSDAAQFLIDRLDDFERDPLQEDDCEYIMRQFAGHVSPAIERVRSALLPAEPEGEVVAIEGLTSPADVKRWNDGANATAYARLAAAQGLTEPEGEAVALSASDRACYEYPGEEQQEMREAFILGATLYAHPSPQQVSATPPAGDVTEAARDVLAERRRQVEAEGWTPEHDDHHSEGEMAAAAACYAFTAARSPHEITNRVWPWSLSWWKPTDKRRNLVKAGALILAEIERLDRAALHAKGGGK
jgi:hypothetical protein